ncbi:MAG: apolipoprotein N-acyltransferase, partial [Spirochaetaceae bacterium]|nr:apolipoprotein N-acyltransferase [Spirochaetaceae bacterium]
ALNGDMDYVQRFVATSGLLDIGDTEAERMETLIRYLPPLVLLSFIWISDAVKRIKVLKLSLPAVIDASAPLWAALSAILFSLSLPNFLVLEGLPFLAWFATAPLYLALRKVSYPRGVTLVILFTGLQSLLINWWQGTFSYISLPFTVGLTLVQYIPFILLLTLTVRRLRFYGILAAPFLWVLWDFLRSLGFLGYPWGILGVSQYSHPALIQSAALGGVWLVSFLPHFTGAVLAFSIEKYIERKADCFRTFTDLWRPWLLLTAAVLGVLAVALSGAFVIRIRDNRFDKLNADEYKNIRILIVQQNTDPRKHDYQLSFDELSRLSEEAMAQEGPFSLIAWPESGFVPDIRFWLVEKYSKWRRGKLVRSFLDWQEGMRIPLVSGNQDHFYESTPASDDPEAPEEVKRIQNSAVYLPPGRKDDYERFYYYKMRLVPFTENFPYREEFPWVAELLHNFSTTQWTPGTEHIVLHAPDFSFSTPLCFEDVFPDHLRRFVLAGSEVFVNMSNDYWANTPLEGYQHGAHALFRAVENRRPLVRATCSGWTIAVDTEGRIAEGWPPFYEPGWTVGEFKIPLEPEQTIYTRFGDWFPIFCGIIWLVFWVMEYSLKWRLRNNIE